MKKLLSWLLPSNAKLAKSAAVKIQGGVNATSDDRKAAMTKYATLAAELAETASVLANIIKDGNIDEIEADQLAAMMEPLFAKARTVLGV